jgi:hypothetical protein
MKKCCLPLKRAYTCYSLKKHGAVCRRRCYGAAIYKSFLPANAARYFTASIPSHIRLPSRHIYYCDIAIIFTPLMSDEPRHAALRRRPGFAFFRSAACYTTRRRHSQLLT